MKTNLLTLALLAAFALPTAAFAQSSGDSSSTASKANAPNSAGSGSSRPSEQQYGQGSSQRCDTLSGAEKQECLQDPGAMTERKAAPERPGAGISAKDSDRGTPATPAEGSPAGE